jgi:hypothetical protein
VVHVLAPGVDVEEGWAQKALAHFHDLRVAAVSPVVLEPGPRGRVVAAGVDYGAGGTPTVCRRLPKSPVAAPVLGPAPLAGFYRRSVLELVGGFETALGDELSTVDVALQCRYLGFRAMLEPECRVFSSPRRFAAGGYQAGLSAERLFLRNADGPGWAKTMAVHALAVAAQSACMMPWTAVSQLSGRLKAWTEWRAIREHRAHLLDLRLKDLMDMTRPLSSGLRVVPMPAARAATRQRSKAG